MRTFLDFIRSEEEGSATLWNLFWLLGFGVLLGLGVDTTAAMNTKARLQIVADAASHAAVMDLFPIATDAIATAVTYAESNIPEEQNVVNASDVTIGYWDRETGTFETGSVPNYNAVRVYAARDTGRDNALITSFLRVAGLYHWDINAQSTSLYYSDISVVDRCRKNGMLAGGKMEQTSNNFIVGDYCMHGEKGIKVSSNNVVTCGVEISTTDPSRWLNQSVGTPSGQPPATCNTDYGSMGNDEMVQQATVYRSMPSEAQTEYDNVKAMLDAFIAGEPVNDPFNAIPPYITNVSYSDLTAFNNAARQGTLSAGTLYVVSCAAVNGNKTLELSGIVRNVGIYTDCEIAVLKDKKVSDLKPTKVVGGYDKNNLCDPDDSTCSNVPWDAEIPPNYSCSEAIAAGYESYATMLDTLAGEYYRDGVTFDTEAQPCAIEPGANGLLDNVFIFTTANETGDRTHTSITFPNNMQIGRLDGCTEGGAARIYTGGSVSTPSGTVVHGSQFVVLGNVSLAAKASGVYGLNVEAAGDISYSAQGMVGGCPASEEENASDVVVTVRPIAIVN